MLVAALALIAVGHHDCPGDLTIIYWMVLGLAFLALGSIRLRSAARDRQVLTRFIRELEARAGDSTD